MRKALADPVVPIAYLPIYREYGLVVGDGPVLQLMSHCPWCGAELPTSLRDEFFDHLDRMDLEPEAIDLPIDFRTDAWWRMRSFD